MILTKLMPPNVVRSGEIPGGGPHPLSFVIIEDGITLITRHSLFRYLEVGPDSIIADTDFLPQRFCVCYSEMGIEQIGIPLMQIPAFCLNIFEKSAQTGAYKQESFNAMMLLMFLTTSGLTNLVCKANMMSWSDEAPVMPLKEAIVA